MCVCVQGAYEAAEVHAGGITHQAADVGGKSCNLDSEQRQKNLREDAPACVLLLPVQSCCVCARCSLFSIYRQG